MQEVQGQINQLISNPVNQKPNSFLVSLLSILLFISIAIAGFFAWNIQKLNKDLRVLNEQLTQKQTQTSEPESIFPIYTEPTTDPTSNWKTYTNKIIKINLKYPSTLNNKNIQIFEPETNTNTMYLNTDKFGSLFFELAILPNTELDKWYLFAYSEAKQKSELPPSLTDGPTISGIKSRRSIFYINGLGDSLVTFVQKDKDLYQISIPPTDNEVQELILSTIGFTN